MNHEEDEEVLETLRKEIKEKVMKRIKDTKTEWPSGDLRMALIQVAFNEGWFLEELN